MALRQKRGFPNGAFSEGRIPVAPPFGSPARRRSNRRRGVCSFVREHGGMPATLFVVWRIAKSEPEKSVESRPLSRLIAAMWASPISNATSSHRVQVHKRPLRARSAGQNRHGRCCACRSRPRVFYEMKNAWSVRNRRSALSQATRKRGGGASPCPVPSLYG